MKIARLEMISASMINSAPWSDQSSPLAMLHQSRVYELLRRRDNGPFSDYSTEAEASHRDGITLCGRHARYAV